MRRWGLHSVPGVPQALVDDTEDVSLDFGNEEELAFRKAKIRYVETRPWASGPKLQIHSFKIHRATTVCSHTDPAPLDPAVGQGDC